MRKRASSTFRFRALVLAIVAQTSCYATDRGVAPPAREPYYPVGLATSPGGKALYVINSDFDLQYEAGTLESYDLLKIREDALLLRNDPRALVSRCSGGEPSTDTACPYVAMPLESGPRCADAPGDTRSTAPAPDGAVGNVCAPAMKPTAYHRDTVRIGAFATDLQLSHSGFTRGGAPMRRLFAPVRGNASVTWIDVADDARDPNADAALLDCGASDEDRTCDVLHQAGNRSDEPGNSRAITLPGEPFGQAQSTDGRFLALTHQNSDRTSLLSTGLPALGEEANEASSPALQFVTDGVPNGGNGLAAIPYDHEAFTSASEVPRPAFMLTSRSATELTLIRLYDDQGVAPDQGQSTLTRPYLVPEVRFPITANADGFDSRDLTVDPSLRIACKQRAGDGASAEQLRACARLPLRVFIANRSPASVLVAELGERTNLLDGAFGVDSLRFIDAIPLPSGPSRIALAPIVDRDGALSLRLFVVCFDSNAVAIIDPETGELERILRAGRGPFALAFDPFDLEAAIRHDMVPRDANGALTYRFGYLASFTESFVQVIDLDRSDPATPTFEKIVFTLGKPTPPKSEQD